jgi:hypothetical protein
MLLEPELVLPHYLGASGTSQRHHLGATKRADEAAKALLHGRFAEEKEAETFALLTEAEKEFELAKKAPPSAPPPLSNKQQQQQQLKNDGDPAAGGSGGGRVVGGGMVRAASGVKRNKSSRGNNLGGSGRNQKSGRNISSSSSRSMRHMRTVTMKTGDADIDSDDDDAEPVLSPEEKVAVVQRTRSLLQGLKLAAQARALYKKVR